ncbi:MAG: hypothetical protein IKF47_01885 [Bacilli bacterium]|nr:hypothetical protein [Bacilli bacterium]
MVEFEKYIKVSNGRMIKFSVHEHNEYDPKTYLIEEYFMENDEITKNYRMSKNGGYSFSGWLNVGAEEKAKIDTISYEFDVNNPLYIPILHNLLYDQDCYTIYDENKDAFAEKYLVFTKIENKIILTFLNTLKEDNLDKKFSISTHDNDLKLKYFFEELIQTLYLEKRQISIEEYLIDYRGIEDEEVKKYMKIYIPRDKQ